MFDVGAPELLVLVILAIILFGPEKLPEFARKLARVIRYFRNIAGNAQTQLRNELGPEYADLELRDLHPKTFVQKHVLSEIEPVVEDVRQEVVRATANGRNAAAEIAADIRDPKVPDQRGDVAPAGAGRPTPVFDPEAT